MSTNSHRILVSGATGFVAGQLIPRLLGLGHEVRAMARQPKQLAARSWSRKVEVVAGDVLAPQTLRQVMHGVDTAYYLIHGMTGGRGYAQRDLVAARNFAHRSSSDRFRANLAHDVTGSLWPYSAVGSRFQRPVLHPAQLALSSGS